MSQGPFVVKWITAHKEQTFQFTDSFLLVFYQFANSISIYWGRGRRRGGRGLRGRVAWQNQLKRFCFTMTFSIHMLRRVYVHPNCTFAKIIEKHIVSLIFWWCACAHLVGILYVGLAFELYVCKNNQNNGFAINFVFPCFGAYVHSSCTFANNH